MYRIVSITVSIVVSITVLITVLIKISIIVLIKIKIYKKIKDFRLRIKYFNLYNNHKSKHKALIII
jgi:hypothetical protein